MYNVPQQRTNERTTTFIFPKHQHLHFGNQLDLHFTVFTVNEPILIDEILESIHILKSCKSQGTDGIVSDFFIKNT